MPKLSFVGALPATLFTVLQKAHDAKREEEWTAKLRRKVVPQGGYVINGVRTYDYDDYAEAIGEAAHMREQEKRSSALAAATCKTCNDTYEVLGHEAQRGVPGGALYIPCPDCTGTTKKPSEVAARNTPELPMPGERILVKNKRNGIWKERTFVRYEPEFSQRELSWTGPYICKRLRMGKDIEEEFGWNEWKKLNEALAEPKKEKTFEHWIPWSGGECPVALDSEVEYGLRDGTQTNWIAKELNWGTILSNPGREITAYRLANPVPRQGEPLLPSSHKYAALQALLVSDDTLKVWHRACGREFGPWCQTENVLWHPEGIYYVGHVAPKD